MTDLLFEVVSTTNYAEKCANIFHKLSRSVVGWESTDYAVTPIQILFRLEDLTFVTEIYLHPKLYKSIKLMQVSVSDNKMAFQSIAKVYDFTDGIRLQISKKCKYLKFVVLQKQHGRAASIDFLRIYGHQYFRNVQPQSIYSAKKQKVEQLFLELGLPKQQKWNVDKQTFTTLHDISKLRTTYLETNQKQLPILQKDIKTVLQIGRKIKKLEQQLKWAEAKQDYEAIKSLKNQIQALRKRRDYFDEKYETSRFQDMITMDQSSNFHDQKLRILLEEDQKKLEEERRRRQQQAEQNQRAIDKQFQELDGQQAWWQKQNQLDKIEHEDRQLPKKPAQKKEQAQDKSKFDFNNPYVYNQGDADMEKYIKPLLSEFGPGFLSDPQLLRRYEQLEYLDVLGARIWVATHSQNWRQRAAAVQAVLNFCEDKLPDRYNDKKTRNLFLAMMEFARINAEDKVLQIYYISLKIMTKALAPPICGDDVPPVLINKSIQKFLSILIEKISEMNTRAKQISLKTLVAIFNHPVADISIAVNQLLKICKQELNVKFTPVQKQNPRIVQSRLEIVSSIIKNLGKDKISKINYDQILQYLMEGAIFHSHHDVRSMAVDTLEFIHKEYPQGTVQWYKGLNGLKPNISAEIQSRLKIK